MARMVDAAAVRRSLAVAFAGTDAEDDMLTATVRAWRDGYVVYIPSRRPGLAGRVAALITREGDAVAADNDPGTYRLTARVAHPGAVVVDIHDTTRAQPRPVYKTGPIIERAPERRWVADCPICRARGPFTRRVVLCDTCGVVPIDTPALAAARMQVLCGPPEERAEARAACRLAQAVAWAEYDVQEVPRG